MIEGQEVTEKLIRLLSVEGQPIKAVLAQTCMGVFFVRLVSDTIFAIPYLPKARTDHHWPPMARCLHFEKHCCNLSLYLWKFMQILLSLVHSCAQNSSILRDA
jgi:hypothetical protein